MTPSIRCCSPNGAPRSRSLTTATRERMFLADIGEPNPYPVMVRFNPGTRSSSKPTEAHLVGRSCRRVRKSGGPDSPSLWHRALSAASEHLLELLDSRRSSGYFLAGTAENSGMSPSSMVGWVKMASRNMVYGSPASIATWTVAMISPASTPRAVKPRM
jgi:hypothetical protein